jgi:hypothetical protein
MRATGLRPRAARGYAGAAQALHGEVFTPPASGNLSPREAADLAGHRPDLARARLDPVPLDIAELAAATAQLQGHGRRA